MATDDRDPDPTDTAGLDAGGGVSPGDTPPNADSSSGATGHRGPLPNQEPAGSNRTPMIITLVFIALITVSVLVYGIAEIAAYITQDEVGGTGQ